MDMNIILPSITDIPPMSVFTPPTPDTNVLANNYIQLYYPIWKQLNIMRSGTAAQKKMMDTFITSVQAWANGVKPKESDLQLIKPI